MQTSITQKSTTKRYARHAGWLIAVLLTTAFAGVGWVKWGGPIRRQLAEWARSDASRLKDAASAYENRDWEKAAEFTRALLKSKSNDPETLRIYARALARLGRDRAAAVIYQTRLDDAHLAAEDLFLLGLMNARVGKLEAALDAFTKAARLEPDNPEVLDHLARVHAAMQRLDEASDAARRLSLQPSSEARGFLLLGEIRGLLDDPKGAIDAMRRGLELDPGVKETVQPSSYYRKLLARSLLQLGRPAEARQALEAIRAGDGIGGRDPETEWLTSRAWLQEGKLPEAAAALALAGSYRAENPLVKEPSPFVGAASCVSCHREISRSHEKSRHARTFHHGPDLLELPFPDRPLADPDDAKVTHTFKRDKGTIKVETRAGEKAFQLIVEYAFGVSDRYVTMIGRDDERAYRALRLSSYHAADGVAWGPTSGDVPDSNSGDYIRGAPIQVRDGVVRCLYCHVTFYRDYRDPLPETGVGPEVADSGIGCERCHGPGGNHLKAIKAGFRDNSIVNVGIAGAGAIGKLCADCHIVGAESDIMNAPEDPEFVRSPGLTLTFSKCFSESDGGMSCLTCHNPHRDDQEPPAFYEAKCLECHASLSGAQKPAGGARAGAAASGGKPASVCPVDSARKCLECHMPKVPVAALHTSLTDHYIRVHDRAKNK